MQNVFVGSAPKGEDHQRTMTFWLTQPTTNTENLPSSTIPQYYLLQLLHIHVFSLTSQSWRFCRSSRSYFSVSSLTMVSQSSVALNRSFSMDIPSISKGLMRMLSEIFFSSSSCSFVLLRSSCADVRLPFIEQKNILITFQLYDLMLSHDICISKFQISSWERYELLDLSQ